MRRGRNAKRAPRGGGAPQEAFRQGTARGGVRSEREIDCRVGPGEDGAVGDTDREVEVRIGVAAATDQRVTASPADQLSPVNLSLPPRPSSRASPPPACSRKKKRPSITLGPSPTGRLKRTTARGSPTSGYEIRLRAANCKSRCQIVVHGCQNASAWRKNAQPGLVSNAFLWVLISSRMKSRKAQTRLFWRSSWT